MRYLHNKKYFNVSFILKNEAQHQEGVCFLKLQNVHTY